MGLFDKKNCNLCGKKVGMLDKKLADGYICKECRKPLSPFFELTKTTTEAEIRSHLEYRKANREQLEGLKISRILGEVGCVLVDEENRKFLVIPDTSGEGLFSSSKKITGLEDALEFNPDILSFDQVEKVEIKEIINQREEKKKEGDKQVSYDPKHITYMCGFAYQIDLKDHPFIRTMYVALNSGSIHIYTEQPRKKVDLGRRLAADLLDLPGLDPEKMPESYDDDSLKAYFLRNPYAMPDYVYGFRTNLKNKEPLQKYSFYMAQTKRVKELLEG